MGQNGKGCLRPFSVRDSPIYEMITRAHRWGRGGRRLRPFVGPLELADLTFRFLASNSVTLLDLTNELVTLTLDDLPVTSVTASCQIRRIVLPS
jgi:hypothetical protein